MGERPTSLTTHTAPSPPALSPPALSPRPSEDIEPVWLKLPDAPLSPRYNALGVYVDGAVVVLGGSDAAASGGVIRPADLRDGAALDLSTRTWRPIAPAPWPPAESAQHTVVGPRVLLSPNSSGAWLLYDSRTDRWSKVPAPPREVPQPTMAVMGQRVFVIDKYVDESPAPVQVLDVAGNTWSALPASKHRPAITDRTVVATDTGLVVMGGDLSPRRAGKHRQAALAEMWDGSRWRRFVSEHAAGLDWHWTGERVISTYRATRDDVAAGGIRDFHASAFDPATGEWERLPWLPPPRTGLLDDMSATASGPQVLGQGYLYDDRTLESHPVLRPSSWIRSTQVLTGDAIVLFGGTRPKSGRVPTGGMTQLALTNEAWLLRTG